MLFKYEPYKFSIMCCINFTKHMYQNFWTQYLCFDCIQLFIQVVCLTTGPKPLPKRALHIVQTRAFSFKWEYPFLSPRSSSSFLRLLPRLPVIYIPPFIFSSITRFRRQFLYKMWPIQFVFRLRISCRIFLCSLTLSNTSLFLTWSVQLIFSSFSSTIFKNFQVFLIYCPKRPSFGTI